MEILTILIPASLLLGGAGLAAFLWALKSKQFDDPAGDANRLLMTDWDDHPKPEEPKDSP
jgi:cbb3-type cytochrome oxidase maturation protein